MDRPPPTFRHQEAWPRKQLCREQRRDRGRRLRRQQRLHQSTQILASSAGAEFVFTTRGAAPLSANLPGHRALGATSGPVVLHGGGDALLQYRVLTDRDTARLDQTTFRYTRTDASGASTLTFSDSVGGTTISYRLADDAQVTQVHVSVPPTTGRAFLLLGLPRGFASHEADTLDDIRHLSYAAKPVTKGATGVTFSSLDPGEQELVPGPLSWAVAKSKYFVVGVLSPSDSTPFSEMQVVGGVRESKLATRAAATVVIPIVNGRAAFNLYTGPQSWERMRALGREFETANPYGGFMQPVVQPFATIVMRVMLWMKSFFSLDYGWLLVIFGLAIRVVLWPLNQSAMRSSIRPPANSARAASGAGALQERPHETAARNHARVSGTWHEPVFRAVWMFAGAGSDARVLRAVLCVSEHD